MTSDDLDKLTALEQAASPGPWYFRLLDDDMCQGAVTVSTRPDDPRGAVKSMRAGTWPSEEVIAACLIQSPPYVDPADERYDENARLIAEMRNALPELIRLAKIGLHDQS